MALSKVVFYWLISASFTSLSFAKSFEGKLSEEALKIIQDSKTRQYDGEFTSLTCGETLTTDSSGFVHKPFEQLAGNERCAWIVGVPGGRGYNIDILYLGESINSGENAPELIITGVQYNRTYSTGLPILTSYAPTTTGSVNLADSNVIVVTFTSPPISGSPSIGGFILQYNVSQDNSGLSKNSTNHILDLETSTDFHYPPNRDLYDNQELAVLLYPPRNNIYSGSTGRVWYKEYGVKDNCYDSLTVYKYNANLSQDTSKWVEAENICGGILTADLQHDDMIMLVFQTDFSRNYEGFFLFPFGCH